MVRISALIASVFGFIGGGMFIAMTMQVISSERYNFLSLMLQTLVTGNQIYIPGIFFLVSFIAQMLMYLFLMFTKKKTIILASLMGIGVVIMNMVAWNFGGHMLHLFSNGLMIFTALMFFIGAIMMRKEGKICVLSGLLLFIFSIVANGVIWYVFTMPWLFGNNGQNFITYQGTPNFESALNLYLMLISIELFLVPLHSLFTGFSRIKKADDEEEDSLSVDKGDAFTSFVEDKPKKKKEKKQSSNDVEFVL
jgi:hypothetical protein